MEDYMKLVQLLELIGTVDRQIMSETDRLNTILLNLQLEGARLNEHNAVDVIAKELQKSIKAMNELLGGALKKEPELIAAMQSIRATLETSL